MSEIELLIQTDKLMEEYDKTVKMANTKNQIAFLQQILPVFKQLSVYLPEIKKYLVQQQQMKDL